MAEVALSSDNVGSLAIGVIVGLVVLGLIAGVLLNRLVARLVVLIVVIVLGTVVWTQRSSLQNRVKNCDTNVSFFGFHTTLSSSAQARCAQLHQS